MQFHTDLIDDGVRVRVEEPRLDAAIAIRFKDRLRDVAARHGPRILLDLTPVQFMDSSGLGRCWRSAASCPTGTGWN